ncbi:MAG TPA: lysophospholipid acyltransferase family protein [Cyclobacteriaceae bacterium]|nr:lysophospholipid acyltransferase family protein [Cyclobacteriaceae bacterium]
MQAIFFYIAYPFIYLIAVLPFPALYKLSDILYYLLRLSGYRKEVVYKNLRNSFPNKSEQEIDAIGKSYFRYLCDLILETLRTHRMSEKESRERCTFHKTDWLDKLQAEGKSFIIVMGHYGNWEWAGPSFTLNTGFQLVVIYRPLSNIYFEKMMCKMRTRFGTRITPVNLTLRDMVANRGSVTATAFIADQTATKDNAYWMTFLNQDTAVFTGPEKLAIKFNYPVVIMNIHRPKRGYYEVFPELLIPDPKNTTENEICEKFMNRLEMEILKDPTIWLWSHRRWKHKRTV